MLNTVSLQGRLVADPELRQTQNGISVCTIRIAVDRDYVPRNGGERQADFFNVTCWRGTAEFVKKYFKKGQMIIVNGTLQSRSYDDKDGIHRYTVDIQADRVNFAGKRESAGEPYNDTESRPAYGGNANYSRRNGANGGQTRRSSRSRTNTWGSGGQPDSVEEEDGDLPF